MIKWNRSDYAKLSYAVREFNSKVQKLERDEQYLLPAQANYQFLKENITTRKELTKTLNDLKKFNPENTLKTYEQKYGVLIPKWNPSSTAVLQEQGIKKLQAQLTPDNLLYRIPTMGNENRQIIISEIESIRNFKQRTIREQKKREKRLKELADLRRQIHQDELYKTNYLKSLEKNFKNLDGYDVLYKKLKKIPANQFFKKLDDDPKYMNVKDPRINYTGNAQEVFNEVLDAWGEILDIPDLQEYEML